MSSLSPARLAAFVGFGTLSLAVGFIAGRSVPEPERIVFLSVGQGDCALIQSAGRAVLIDDGPESPTSSAAAQIILPRLRALGVDRIDLILLSHPDSDHVGGTPDLLRSFPQVRLAMSAVFRDNAEMARRLHEWQVPASRIDWLPAESTGRMGNLEWRISCPPLHEGEDVNDGSMFVRVGRGPAEALFTGDAPIAVEEAESSNGDWTAKVMKAGHHGSRTATGDPWLRTVHPEWVIISCGRDNRYGHPNRETLERISKFGARVARTDTEGDVEFDFLGQRLVRSP